MTITHPARNLTGRTALSSFVKRLVRWINASSPRRSRSGKALPRELEDAEDWLLDDLGLTRHGDRAEPKAGSKQSRRR